MNITNYSSPLPEEKLIERFRPAFQKLSKGYSATIFSIPHLGHTSHMRFLNSRPDILNRLGISDQVFIFIDRDKVVSGYESFASELLINLDPSERNSKSVLSQNAYVLNKEIINKIKDITKQKTIIIAVSLEENLEVIIPEIENLFHLIQKASQKFPVIYLWITNTSIIRNHNQTIPSSTFLTNLYLQKNFDKYETDYCLERISFLKGSKPKKEVMSNSLNLTGGFACTFHQLINTGNIFPSGYVRSCLRFIKKEVDLNNQLVTKDGLDFLYKLDLSENEFEDIKLRNTPTAQEINLLKCFQSNLGNPISRDIIAECIWGKAFNTKYSDWAIDKAISRLRKNVSSDKFKIITVKNLGYELVKL